MMDLDQLQSVRDRERQSDTLQQLRESFYADAAELIADLRAEREQAAEAANDPFGDPTVRRLSNDIETAEHTVQAIYERRVGKLVKAASFAAADQGAPDTDGMTTEEEALFETIVEDIRANRQRVLDILAGDADRPEPSGGDDHPVPPQPGGGDAVSAADVMGGAGPTPPETPPAAEPDAESADPAEDDRNDDRPPEESEQPGAEETESGSPPADPGDEEGTRDEEDAAGEDPDVERATVRITEDVGEIFGVDERAYDLATDDVVTLPAANAEPLIERDAAERLE